MCQAFGIIFIFSWIIFLILNITLWHRVPFHWCGNWDLEKFGNYQDHTGSKWWNWDSGQGVCTAVSCLSALHIAMPAPLLLCVRIPRGTVGFQGGLSTAQDGRLSAILQRLSAWSITVSLLPGWMNTDAFLLVGSLFFCYSDSTSDMFH